MKTYIEFRSEYDDDSQHSENGYVELPRGRNIMESYCRWLKENQYPVDWVSQYEEYGWEVQIRIDDGWVWQMIQLSDEFLMIAEHRSIRIPFIKNPRIDSQLYTALSLFKEFLEQDDRLEFIGEYTRKEYEKQTC
jgi:hypothetical protein